MDKEFDNKYNRNNNNKYNKKINNNNDIEHLKYNWNWKILMIK